MGNTSYTERALGHEAEEFADLLGEVLSELFRDRNNVGAYRKLLRRYPLRAVRVALDETVRKPRGHVRNPGAYFTDLTKRITQELEAVTPVPTSRPPKTSPGPQRVGELLPHQVMKP